jgi:DNA-binding PadR family transcriptional regulator
MKDVENLSHGVLRLSTSTLYDALERLLKQGLITRIEEETAQAGRKTRKNYHLNDLGRRVLDKETNRMRMLLEVATLRLKETTI